MTRLATRGELVGRLFNRSVIQQLQSNDFVDPFERQWHTQSTYSASGGIVSWYKHELNKSKLRQVDDLSKKNETPQPQHEDHIPPNPHHDSTKFDPENHRDRIRDTDYDSDTSDETTIGIIETHLPLCFNEEEPSPLLQPCRRNMKSSRRKTKTRLWTKALANVKIVAFSGSPTLVVKPNQIDMVLRCDFVDVVEVFYIPAISDYGREVLKTLWYTKDEIEQMKRDECFCRTQIPGKGGQSSARSTPTTSGRSNHNHTIATVLEEQEKQRKMCHKIYGRLIDSSGNRRSSGILCPKRLREVYATEGNTQQCQEEASVRAKICLLQCDPKGRDDFDQHETTTTDEDDSSRLQKQEKYAINERSSLMAHSYSYFGFCLDISMTFGDCIDSIFSALLIPFLEQRDGPLFLDIGEEIHVVAS